MNIPEALEVVIRSVCIIFGLFFITKLLGKKQLSKLSFFEYIAGITIGDIAGTLSMDTDLNITNGIVSILIWSAVPVIISFFLIRSRKFQEFIEGKPTLFIKDGKILEENLKKEKFTADELLSQLRKSQVFNIKDIETAMLEPCGNLSFLLKKEKQPLTYGDTHQEVFNHREPKTVIIDGKIQDESLNSIGLNRGWLNEELKKKGLTSKEVFLVQIDHENKLSVDLYNDKLN
ncbi:DUF421 domain-containing protein [Litchfieldia alkalitelluris]|uniref:DUF421 domain-containing protein n=1 Tax=Litchfieldia alkalitelluris TaxID=304268 RepID=UPI001F199BE3|nr:DUF421 domain-containing protein [Litchfieldia alkalitelluris]